MFSKPTDFYSTPFYFLEIKDCSVRSGRPVFDKISSATCVLFYGYRVFHNSPAWPQTREVPTSASQLFHDAWLCLLVRLNTCLWHPTHRHKCQEEAKCLLFIVVSGSCGLMVSMLDLAAECQIQSQVFLSRVTLSRYRPCYYLFSHL